MKSLTVFLALLASVNAFTAPPMATRAVGRKVAAKKPAAKKPVAKKPVAKKPAAKKPAAKKPAAKKPVARKPAAKKPVARKPVAKKPVAKRTPPKSKGYPTLGSNAKVSINIKASGRAPPKGVYQQPDYSDPRLQIKRDPAFYAAAAKTRTSLFSPTTEFVYEDGLTVIERNQRETLPA